jgi:hypothetical protein
LAEDPGVLLAALVVVVTPSPCDDVDVVVDPVVVVFDWQTEMLTVPPLASCEPPAGL